MAAGLLDNARAEQRICDEVEEETGCRISAVRKVYELFMSPGSVTERLHFFIGQYAAHDQVGDGGGVAGVGEDIEGEDIEGEDIEVHELPYEQALAMVNSGELMDAKTVLLLLHLQLHLL